MSFVNNEFFKISVAKSIFTLKYVFFSDTQESIRVLKTINKELTTENTSVFLMKFALNSPINPNLLL